MRRQVDILVHVPLEAEYLQVREVFPVREELKDDLNVIAIVDAPSNFKMAVIVQEKMGRGSAQNACQKALSLFDPKLYVCLGIAGGLTKDLSLGDVCYTGHLHDVYDNSKVTDVAEGGLDIAFSPEHYSTERGLTAAMGFVRTLTSLSELYASWRGGQGEFVESLALLPVPGRDDQVETIAEPKCLNGDIVCGVVSESDKYRERLKGITRNMLAVETESGPIFEICQTRKIPAITIRGISDYANASKGKLEGDTKDAVRRIAARNAATFLHMQLQSELFIEAFAKASGSKLDEPELDLAASLPPNIPRWLDTLADQIDGKLRELSPQFRTKPNGFRPPSPRVKPETSAAAGDPKKRPVAEEFISAVARHKRIILHIPRTYPDQALPWVLAGNLLQTDIAGKKVIPVVLDGQKFGPPKDDFAHLAQIPLTKDIEQLGGEYVFIIEEPIFKSKTKIQFLSNEIKSWGDARVVIVTRADRVDVEAHDYTRQLSADSFELCDVSFLEMAAFVESSFDLPSHEAEVVALKLRGMFQKFALPAHPSFFAGIPSDALSALLLANRRSELIQLAVDGSLSFLVAADKESIRLSRTNRKKFLRSLAVKILHEKLILNEGDVVKLAKDMSDEFDYGLNPIEFVNSFVEAGLLHFRDGRVHITLPFIESYLFAEEMNNDPELALAYFKAHEGEVDLSTFDLYAEIGASPSIIEQIMSMMDEAVAAFAPTDGPHILLTETINPVVFKNPARLTNLSQKVSEARTAISEGASHRDEKARILDIADRVNEDVAEHSLSEKKSAKEDEGVRQNLARLMRVWTLSTVLLGSGAESINGDDRTSLAAKIIQGAEAILEATLRHISSMDFEDIKRQIMADENFRTELGAKDDEAFDGIVSAFVDLVEFLVLSESMDRVFDQLPDRASHKIVGNSIARTKVETPIQEIIKGNWLLNINPSAAKGDFIRRLHSLPKVQFLRASLTSIFMTRVKWRVPTLETRLALLDAAEEAVRPFNPHLDKGEILRFVGKHIPGSTDDPEEVS